MSAAFDYSRPRRTAERLIARFGQGAHIRRQLQGTGPEPWNPHAQSSAMAQDYACVVAVFSYTARERTGSRIGEKDRRVLISTADLDVAPVAGDFVVLDGRQNSIVSIETLAPGGTTLLYDAQVTM